MHGIRGIFSRAYSTPHKRSRRPSRRSVKSAASNTATRANGKLLTLSDVQSFVKKKKKEKEKEKRKRKEKYIYYIYQRADQAALSFLLEHSNFNPSGSARLLLFSTLPIYKIPLPLSFDLISTCKTTSPPHFI